MTAAQTRIEDLRKTLAQANFDYYQLNAPTLTDSEFDRLLLELKQLELKHPELADPNSPTARVGGDTVEGFQKRNHAVKMLSLDNAFTISDIERFFGGPRDVILEPKIDGLSLGLRYRDGRLVHAVTRGDGLVGDDVTVNARTIRSIPLVLPEPLTIEVRGEVYLGRTQFELLNEQRKQEGDELFANPRNAAAGTMKQRDSAEVARRKLGFCAYRLLSYPYGENEMQSATRDLELLDSMGFLTPFKVPTPDGNVSAVRYVEAGENWFERVAEILAWLDKIRKSFEFDIDGAVLKLDGLEEQAELGEGNKSVNWAVAFKYPPERKLTKLLEIVLTVGRTGQITPNAVLEPISLSGSMVRAASLCNEDEIKRLKVHPGDQVYVEKAAEIIPKIRGVNFRGCAWIDGELDAVSTEAASLSNAKFFEDKTAWAMPENCPSCHHKLVRDGVHYFCVNHKECPAQIFERLAHAVAKSALDIDGCGEAQIRGLIEAGCRELSDLFKIQVPEYDWSRHGPVNEDGGVGRLVTDGTFHLGFMKPAALKKFLSEREKAKSKPLWRKLAALGIDGVGRTLCKELAVKYSSIVEMAEASKTELVTLLGPVNYANFVRFIADHSDEIDRLHSLGLSFEEDRSKQGPLSGKTFVITGALMTGTRDQVSQRIETAGGVMKASVGKTVNYLIVGEGGGNNKSAAAAKYGTKCIDEKGLYDLLGIPMPTGEAYVEREF